MRARAYVDSGLTVQERFVRDDPYAPAQRQYLGRMLARHDRPAH